MTARTVVATLLVILALLAIAVGVIYMIEPIHSLPSFFPGHSKGSHYTGKHTKRGLIALAIGVVCLVVGVVVGIAGRREKASSYRY